MSTSRLRAMAGLALVFVFALSGCGGNHASGGAMLPSSNAPMAGVPMGPDVSILHMLGHQVVIGSTIDPKFHQLNPYGLSVALKTRGPLHAGDLVVCNFNAKSNVQGTGFTIVALAPTPGSSPRLIAASKSALTGCNALAMLPNNDIAAAAFSSDDEAALNPHGHVIAALAGKQFDHPFGSIFAAPASGTPALYVSDAGNGDVVRVTLAKVPKIEVIAKNFPVNHGKPGSIFSPSGLAYDAGIDRLYVVDGTNNTLVALDKVTSIPPGGIKVGAGGKTFSGPNGSQAHVLHAGAPLNGPISSALLFNGHIVIGNTTNPNGKNLMIEFNRKGAVLAIRNVDRGAAGSLFGMVATGTSAATTKLYFNDDNNNNLQALEP